MEIVYRPIGIIHTPFKGQESVPVQPVFGKDIEGRVEVFEEYSDGLQDIDGFSHIILIYHLHKSKGFNLKVKPHWSDQLHGVFTTRSPRRPNPIGISVVELIEVKGNTLIIRGIDILDETPLLDIKPYIPEFDSFNVKKIGWFQKEIEKIRRLIPPAT